MFHLDLYRLADAADALAGGLLDERQADGVALVEWAERLGERAPGGAPGRADRRHGRRRAADHAARRRRRLRTAISRPRHDRRRPDPRSSTRRPRARSSPWATPTARWSSSAAGRPATATARSSWRAIDALLTDRGVALADLGAIAVGTGPGAFTGLRVGIATAKGLAHALSLPIVGVATGVRAARRGSGRDPGRRRRLVLLQPAGPNDRVVVRRGEAARILPGGTEPDGRRRRASRRCRPGRARTGRRRRSGRRRSRRAGGRDARDGGEASDGGRRRRPRDARPRVRDAPARACACRRPTPASS